MKDGQLKFKNVILCRERIKTSQLEDKISAFLGYYAASSGNLLATFWGNLLVPSSRVKKSKDLLSLEDETDRCPEMSVKDYHSTLHNIPEEHKSHQHHSRSLKSSQLEVHKKNPM
jgi:hypothetical protein